jgi:hypothetical protein
VEREESIRESEVVMRIVQGTMRIGKTIGEEIGEAAVVVVVGAVAEVVVKALMIETDAVIEIKVVVEVEAGIETETEQTEGVMEDLLLLQQDLPLLYYLFLHRMSS